MTTTATTALQLAQRMLDALADSDIDNQGFDIGGAVYTADEIRSVLRRGLDSLRQQPLTIDGMQVQFAFEMPPEPPGPRPRWPAASASRSKRSLMLCAAGVSLGRRS